MKKSQTLVRTKALAFHSKIFSLTIFFYVFLLLLSLPYEGNAQAYIKQSRYLGGDSYDPIVGTQIVNGYRYIVSNASDNAGANTYPITTGGPNPGDNDIQVTKLNTDGTIAWSRFIGGSRDDQANDFMVLGNYIYIVGYTISNNFPVTDGSTLQTGSFIYNGFLTKVDISNGAIEYSSLRGVGAMQYIQLDNGYMYIEGRDQSTSITKITVSRFDPVAETWLYKKTFGGSANSDYLEIAYPTLSVFPAAGAQRSTFKAVNGSIYFVATTAATDFPVTDGSSGGGGDTYVFVKLDAVAGSIISSGYLGSPGYGVFSPLDLQVDNGEAYFLGLAFPGGFPTTTDGSSFTGLYYQNLFLIKFGSNGHIVYSKLLAADSDQAIYHDENFALQIESGTVYIAGNAVTITLPGASNSNAGDNDLMIIKLNAFNGSPLYSGYIGSSAADYFNDFKVVNGDMYVVGTSGGSNYPVTNGSTNNGFDMVFTKVNSNNAICFSTYLGGKSSADYSSAISVIADSVFITGGTSSTDFPVTDNSSFAGGEDLTFTQFVFNPAINGIADTLNPSTQNVCKNGLPQLITGVEITLVSDSMPKLYYNGVPAGQSSIIARYQWQVSNNPTGPWTNIPGATKKDYTPQSTSVNQYFRRLAYTSGCSSTPASTSDVDTLLVTSDVAPTVNAGGVFYTCPGTPITLGGSPTATAASGATISSYLWTPTDTYTPGNTSANPSVSPADTTIYTVTVTDSKGCTQIGQALVNAYQANAGPDLPICANQTVRIGSAPIAGLSGVIYSWTSSPTDATMSCTTCAQPEVHPSSATTYTLSVTLPVTGGGTCSSTDQVTVTPVAAPTGDIGGPDVTTCSSGSIALGQPAQSGFTYTWAPGIYLDDVNAAQPNFTPGNINMPNPNPYTYYVTASKGGCSFVDSVKAYTIEANAGPDICGPATIGMPDRTPSINETYLWTVISGDEHIIGANNLPQINVSATTSGATVYELSVTSNGVTCTDDVSVTACGCVLPIINVTAPFSCPSYDINSGNVTMKVSSAISSTFNWSPSAGLSVDTGAVVTLTDNIPRTYTVTATSTIDPSVSCTNTITVNQPTWAKPSFTAQDVTVCPGVPVQIGQANVTGYGYSWTGNNLDDNTISNPTATVNSTTNYPVLVTDVGSGCTVTDTATVSIPGFPANLAGADISLCGTAIVQLGANPVAGLTYLWTPSASYTPGNTVANPTVPVAVTTTFHVTATNTATGCTADDDIVVTVNPAAPTFSFTDQTFCPSTSGAIALPAGPSGMSAYSWSPASLVQNPTSNGPTATTLSTPPASATAYSLTVTNSNGCQSNATVNFTPSIPNPVAGSSRTACKGTPIQLGTSPGMAGTYSWTVTPDPGSATYTLSSTSISNPVFTPTSAGSFTIKVSYTSGGCTTTDVVVINSVDYTMSPIPSQVVCRNSCVQIGTSSPDASATYSWSPVTGLSDPNSSNPTVCVTTSDVTYQLTATGANGCSATQTVIVGVNPQPAPSVSIPSIDACYGGGSVVFQPDISPTGSYNYLWGPNDGSLSSIYSQTPSARIGSLGAKTYNLNVTNSSTGCSNNAAALLNVNNCALPLGLESFTATAQSKNVLLTWKISDEANLSYYVVEFSVDGINFGTIGTKKATNSSLYEFLHTSPVNGINYYRLRMVSTDGSITYSEIRTVKMQLTDKSAYVQLYPNPANNILFLAFSGDIVGKKASMVVLSADGRTLMKKKVTALGTVESIVTASFAKGMYYVQIISDGAIVNKPVVIIR